MKKIALSLFIACIGTSAYSESDYELAQTYRQLGMKASEATEKLMTVSATITDKQEREKEEK